jgi:hypothetical protein
MNQFPPGPCVYHIVSFRIFSKIRRDIRSSRCTSSLIFLPLFDTGVVDTGGKFAAGIVHTVGKFAALKRSLSFWLSPRLSQRKPHG